MPVRFDKKETNLGRRGLRHLLFFRDDKGVLQVRLLELQADADYLAKNNWEIRSNNFSGFTTSFDLKKGFLTGYYFREGKLAGYVELELADSKKKLAQRNPGPNCAAAASRPENTYVGAGTITIYMCQFNVMEIFSIGNGGYYYRNWEQSESARDYFIEDNYYLEGWSYEESNEDVLPVILENSFANNQKAKCIYDQLLTNPDFNNLLSQFNQRNTWKYLSFAVEEAGSGVNGHTGPVGSTPGSGYIRIVIDDDWVQNGSIIGVANTIIHECFHAELLGRIADIGGWGNLDPSNFPSIYQYYMSYPDDVSLIAHNHLAEVYLPTQVKILKNLFPPPNSTITDQHYWALAWTGLLETSAYQASFPDSNAEENRANLAQFLKEAFPTNCSN